MNLHRYLLASVIILSLVSLTTGCSLFGGEEDTIEIAPSPVVDNQFPIQQVWNNSLSSNANIYTLLSPAESNNIIYSAGRSGQVKALELASGRALWNVNLASSSLFSSQSALLSGGVTVDDQYVYVGSERAIVYALDKTNGSIVWQKEAKGEILAKPVTAEELLVVHTANGFLQAFDRHTGEPAWDVNMSIPTLTLRGNSTPTLAYGAIITGDDTGHVNAYFAKDGQLIWQQRISQPKGSTEIAKLNDVDATPIIDHGLAYAIGYNGNIAALDLSNGQIIWRKALGSANSFSLDQSHIFVVDQDDNILSLTKNGGSVIWKMTDLLHRQLTDPVIYQDYIVVGDFEGYLYFIDKNTGDIVSKTQVSNSGLLSRPLVVDDKIVVQAKNGNIYAYSRR